MSHTSNAEVLQALALSIRKARENAGLKQEVAAKLLGVTRSTLSGYENDKAKDMTVDDLLNICRVYRCSLAPFFGPPPPEEPTGPVVTSPIY